MPQSTQARPHRLTLGATVEGERTHFRVWAPNAQSVVARVLGRGDFPLQRDEHGIFTATLDVHAGDRYFYLLDGSHSLPDPVSRFLPEGVHGPTQIVDPARFEWTDPTWHGLDIRDYIIYELHVGTFTPQGTFDGVIEKLSYLKSLGVTAIELMPVAAFPGTHNWGYDGASLYAVQNSYGGSEGLRRLVDAAHGAGLAVLLDVVYNHFGPEGNYLAQFGPYFTEHHHTPWGAGINYDQPGCEHVRRYIRDNALYWIREYHLDGLRLDAIQTIQDDSKPDIIAEVSRAVHNLEAELGRKVVVIGETDENDARDLRSRAEGGRELDEVWSDDFHHVVHTLLTGEKQGYYRDFAGRPELLERVLDEGFAFQGEPFAFWKGRARGTDPRGIPLYRHVICTQNHDQVGNRAMGERLTALAPRGARKVAAALLLLAPHTPLLFMGEEYDEPQPFQFFTDFGDPGLQKAVSEGRRKEFEGFGWGEVPDPQDPATFQRSRLSWKEDREMLAWHRALLDLRRRYVMTGDRTCHAEWRDGVLTMRVPSDRPRLLITARFAPVETPHPDHGELLLESDEDGYRVDVYRLKPETD